jgi:glycosyltransferase involved in cell wall biosynthesis
MNSRKNIINLHIYPSTFLNESRIEKEVKSLIDLGLVDKVILIGYECFGKPKIENINSNLSIFRVRLLTQKSKYKLLRYFMFLEFFLKALYISMKTEYSIVNLHSLHVLPIGILVKVFRKKTVIYDAHELETEVSGSKGLIRLISKIIEWISIKYVDYVIVVSQSISDWYSNKYKIENIKVIRNIPNKKTLNEGYDIFRKSFSIPEEHVIFIYQGLLNKSRGVNIIINSFKKLNSKDKHIIFLGDGPLKEEIKALTSEFKNIHYHPMVNTKELFKFTSSADVGIHMIFNSCLNHYYCLPNKIFEYFLFGIPVIVSDFPEMKKIVDINKIGWCINPDEVQLGLILNNLNFEIISEFKKNVHKSKDNYSWEKEELNYIEIYKSLLITKYDYNN